MMNGTSNSLKLEYAIKIANTICQIFCTFKLIQQQILNKRLNIKSYDPNINTWSYLAILSSVIRLLINIQYKDRYKNIGHWKIY